MSSNDKKQQAPTMTMQLPSLVGCAEFVPTGLMIQTLCVYLQSFTNKENKSAIKILKETGHSTRNWYNWIYSKPGFIDWWNKVIADYHANYGLSDVYNAIYREALKNSAQDRKLYLERFDDKYRPKSEQEIKASVGRRPPDSIEAIEMSDYKLKQLQSAPPARDDREAG